MPSNFDWIAPYYDSLARLVFGDSIKRCQLHYLSEIQAGAKVLILGGGTGWIITELIRVNPTCTIHYIEVSSEMIKRTSDRITKLPAGQVFLLQGTESRLQEFEGIRFDAVIANFYFDLFTDVSLRSVLATVAGTVQRGSKLLISEFVGRNWWQRLALMLMYRFFRVTCAVEARRLPDWQDEVSSLNFSECDTSYFCGGFIISALYDFRGA